MPSLRLFRRALIAAVLLVAAIARPGLAAPADAYTVRGVDVDVTANAVAAAKDQALAEAQRIAFRRLLERLTVPADQGRLPHADALQYVRDFAIEQERSSAVRYIATLTVRFNPVAVRKLLRDANIHYAETRPRAVVILPVFKDQTGRMVLWEDPNPWRAAWTAAMPGGLVPLVVPGANELGDLAQMTPDQALGADADRLEAIGQRWRSPDVLVAAAAVNPAGNQIDVSLTATPGVPKPFDVKSYAVADGTAPDALLRQAVVDIGQGLDVTYKSGNLLQFDRAASLSAIVPLGGLEDWLAVRERLGRVAQVRRYEVVSLSRDEAALVLHIAGDQEQVRAALAAAGLPTEWNGSFWTMRPGGRR